MGALREKPHPARRRDHRPQRRSRLAGRHPFPGRPLLALALAVRNHTATFHTVPNGKLGIVEARDGQPVQWPRARTEVECKSFQDARAFLTNGGERGPQISIIPPGTYRINTEVFQLTSRDVTEIPDNMVGIITTREGKPRCHRATSPASQIEDHSMYQNAQAFSTNGGYKGLQEQVLLAGRYFINPLFATVESKPMTEVPIAYAGVVIAYVGEKGIDLTGDSFKHGNLVSKGQKGVWADPLDPGKYPINTYTHKVETVPTANVVLNWATGKIRSAQARRKALHHLRALLRRVHLQPGCSQIIHIPRNDAPKVIARFGNMINLVTQVLEPTIGNYFRNAAQGSDVIDFLKQRQRRQDEAKARIGAALNEYNVGAVDTLIGDIVPPEELMKTLTDRKIAEQEQVTYTTQKQAEEARKDLQQAKAIADTQPRVVDAERRSPSPNSTPRPSSAVEKRNGAAKPRQSTPRPTPSHHRRRRRGGKITAVGSAEADVIKKTTPSARQLRRCVQVMQALAQNRVQLVPQIVAGSGGSQGGTLVDVLLANLLRDNLKPTAPTPTPPDKK